MEDELDAIEEGKEHWVARDAPLLRAVHEGPRRAPQVEMRDVKREERPTDLVCEKCGKPMVIKWGRRGEFLACSGYPECRNTTNFTRDDDGKIVARGAGGRRRGVREVRQADAGALRPLRQVPRLLRLSRVQEHPAAPQADAHRRRRAPMCGQGEMYERRLAARQDSSTACNRYPECKFATWDKPVLEPCPKCGAPFLTEKVTKRYGIVRNCPRETCDWVSSPSSPRQRAAAARTARGRIARRRTTSVRRPARSRAAHGLPRQAEGGRRTRRPWQGRKAAGSQARSPAEDRDREGGPRRPEAAPHGAARRRGHDDRVTVVGGGLAGCEAAWQLARRGVPVDLYEMRPRARHRGARRPISSRELVCSNSFRNATLETAVGLLKEEMRRLGSLVMPRRRRAHACRPARALAVDRDRLRRRDHAARSRREPLVRIVREEVDGDPRRHRDPRDRAAHVAGAVARRSARVLGATHLYFYDAIAPIVTAESIDMDVAWKRRATARAATTTSTARSTASSTTRSSTRCSRPRRCRRATSSACIYFEGCMPIEEMARRGRDTLAFGPMRPVGLDRSARPAGGRTRCVQLRQDDAEGRALQHGRLPDEDDATRSSGASSA